MQTRAKISDQKGEGVLL